MSRPKGYVLYKGKSRIAADEVADVVAVVTLESGNRKTGNMAQVWILADGQTPIEAYKSGADSVICGDCPHRWALGGDCYVNIGQAPTSVYRAYQNGSYEDASALPYAKRADLLKGYSVRFGAYGDPAAVPVELVALIAQRASMHTGYTHQWMQEKNQPLRHYLMASVDSEAERDMAMAKGWRSFFVRYDDVAAVAAVQCVADSHGKTCAECGLCDGAESGKTKDIYIKAHGSRSNKLMRV